jgi:hypothetical protein
MEGRGHVELDAHAFCQRAPQVGSESGISVRYKGSGGTPLPEHMLHEQVCILANAAYTLVRAEQAKRKPVDLGLSEVVEILCHTAPRPPMAHSSSGPVPMELGNVNVAGGSGAGSSEPGPSDLTSVLGQLVTQLANMGVRGDRGRSPFGRGRSPSPHRDRPLSPGRSYGGGYGGNRGYSPGGNRGYANTGRGYMPAGRGHGGPSRGGYSGGRNSRPPPDPRLHPSWPRGMIRSDAELNQLASERRCFCCRDRGHSWQQCPQYVRRPNG